MGKPSHQRIIKKAAFVFSKKEWIESGEGLTRRELKILFNRGVVSRRLTKKGRSGSLVFKWRPTDEGYALLQRAAFSPSTAAEGLERGK